MHQLTIGRLNGRFVVTWHDADGKRKRFRLRAETRADAEREAIDVHRRETFGPSNPATIKDIWEAFRTEKDGRPVAKTMGYEGRSLLPVLGHLRPDQIERAHIQGYIAARRKAGRKDGTIWTELGHLRTALRWAQDKRMIEHAPKIERPPKPAPKDRWLTKAEARRLIEAADAPHIALAIRLMLATAGRVGAILDLTWDRVDFERGEIDLRADADGPRKGRARVPMNAGVRKALEEARRMALSGHVIEWNGQRIASIKTGFGAAVRNAQLHDVTPHVLRHSAAVWMASEGVPMSRIAQYLGHSSEAVTFKVYARYAPDHLRDEADILDV